jgi:hypothetical protein
MRSAWATLEASMHTAGSNFMARMRRAQLLMTDIGCNGATWPSSEQAK